MSTFEQVKIIDKEKQEEKVLEKIDPFVNNLFITDEGIIFLKTSGEVILNKTGVLSKTTFNGILLDYNKTYIEVYSKDGYGAREFIYKKNGDNILYESKSLIGRRDNYLKNSITLSRKEVEDLFDPNNYDCLTIFDTSLWFEYVYSKEDGEIIKKKLIPTDEEIIKIDYKKQKRKKEMASAFGNNEYKKPKKRKLEEIEELKILGTELFGPDLFLISIRNGKIAFMYFDLTFVGIDEFRLDYSDIKVDDMYNTKIDGAKSETYKIEKDIKVYQKDK